MKQQLRHRLAALQIEVDETTAERHLAALAVELRHPAQPARRLGSRRIKRATLGAASLLVLLPGAALAAEGAVPGDILYPIKIGVEQVVSLVDPNVEAEHRIEEVELLVDRGTPFDEVSDRLADADQAVLDRDVPEDLLNRLDAVRERVGVGPDGDTPDAEDPPQDTPGETNRQRDGAPTEQTKPADTSTTTTPPDPDRPGQRGSTTTTAPPNDDRPGRDVTTTTQPRGGRGDRSRDG